MLRLRTKKEFILIINESSIQNNKYFKTYVHYIITPVLLGISVSIKLSKICILFFNCVTRN